MGSGAVDTNLSNKIDNTNTKMTQKQQSAYANNTITKMLKNKGSFKRANPVKVAQDKVKGKSA